jgi:hypothetical protein
MDGSYSGTSGPYVGPVLAEVRRGQPAAFEPAETHIDPEVEPRVGKMETLVACGSTP